MCNERLRKEGNALQKVTNLNLALKIWARSSEYGASKITFITLGKILTWVETNLLETKLYTLILEGCSETSPCQSTHMLQPHRLRLVQKWRNAPGGLHWGCSRVTDANWWPCHLLEGLKAKYKKARKHQRLLEKYHGRETSKTLKGSLVLRGFILR